MKFILNSQQVDLLWFVQKIIHWSAHCYKDANLTWIREAMKCIIEYPVKSYSVPLVQAPALLSRSSAVEGGDGATLRRRVWTPKKDIQINWDGTGHILRRRELSASALVRSSSARTSSAAQGGDGARQAGRLRRRTEYVWVARTSGDGRIELNPASLAVNCA